MFTGLQLPEGSLPLGYQNNQDRVQPTRLAGLERQAHGRVVHLLGPQEIPVDMDAVHDGDMGAGVAEDAAAVAAAELAEREEIANMERGRGG